MVDQVTTNSGHNSQAEHNLILSKCKNRTDGENLILSKQDNIDI